MVLSRNQDLS